MTDEVEVHNHGYGIVTGSDGERHQVLLCTVTDEDVNRDGTISVPTSGECTCFDQEEPRDETMLPASVLMTLVEQWRKQGDELAEVVHQDEGPVVYEKCADELEELIDEW